MKVTPFQLGDSHRTGTLQNITAKEIQAVLGFAPNMEDDPCKVENSWGFKAGKVECGIWDYRGSHKWKQFSTYGPHEVFAELFGDKYVNQVYVPYSSTPPVPAKKKLTKAGK